MLEKLLIALALLATAPLSIAADPSDADVWLHCNYSAATLVRDDTYENGAWFDDDAGNRQLSDKEAARFDSLPSGTRLCMSLVQV